MSTHEYTRIDEHGSFEFSAEVETALPGKIFRIHLSDMTRLVFDDTLTAGEVTTLDAAVAAFSPLAQRKRIRILAIDSRTSELIAAGFTYNSVEISLSLNSQSRIHGTYTARALLTYPVEWNSLDDTALLTLVDQTDVESFFGAALTAVRTAIDSGTVLKTAVRDATTQAELDAVVDNR
jgi:hypothetical protein